MLKNNFREVFDYTHRKPKNYWNLKENRLYELDLYLKSNSLDRIYSTNEGSNIISMFKKYKHNINKALEELGYENLIYKPKDFYSKIENLINVVKPVADIYGRFPTYSEITNYYNKAFRHLTKENLAIIRKKLGYMNDDLVDDSGFYNRSSYEYIVAQFLINNNVKFKREQLPFPKNEPNYRSDFTFYTYEGDVIHLEIWGAYNEKYNHFDGYSQKVKDKILLYEKYNIKLISIYPETFISNSYSDIQKILKGNLEPILSIKLQDVEQNKLIPITKLTDDEIFKILMTYSEDGITLPTSSVSKEVDNLLNNVIQKRYKNIMEFAKKYNVKTKKKHQNYWDKNKVLYYLDNIYKEYGYIPSKNSLNKYLKGLSSAIDKHGGLINLKLEYLNNLTNKNKTITIQEISWLKQIANNSMNNLKINSNHKQKAKDVLEKEGEMVG